VAEETNPKRTLALDELGVTGLRMVCGKPDEEALPQLKGQRGIRVFAEMRDNDPVVGAILFAIEMLIRQVEWSVEPASPAPVDLEAADFLKSCLGDMSDTWEDTVSSILTFLPFGFAVHEEVYKIRGGASSDPTRRSKYADGRIGWRKLPPRAQETIEQWLFDVENGELAGLVQVAEPDYRPRTIPIDRFLLFRTTAGRGSPEGRSILRAAFRPWHFKRRIEEIEGIGIERDLAGLPVAKVPPELLAKDARPEHRALLEEIKRLVRNIRRDESEGVVFPMARDADGHEMFDLALLSTGGARQFDTSAIVGRYDSRIAMTVLADFVLLGHEKTGSWALASSKTNLFATALGAWLGSICDVFNRVAIPRLFALNTFRVTELPTLTHGDIESLDLSEIAQLITALSGAGAQLFPDESLERWARQKLGAPAPESEL
jgi:hypothetical protein